MTIYKAAAYAVDGNWRAGIETGGPTEILRSIKGAPRTFRSKAAAMTAANKEIQARLAAEADIFKRRPLRPMNPLRLWLMSQVSPLPLAAADQAPRGLRNTQLQNYRLAFGANREIRF